MKTVAVILLAVFMIFGLSMAASAANTFDIDFYGLPGLDQGVMDTGDTITFNAGNTGDDQYVSGVFIDSNSLSMAPGCPVVPIPASLLLFASGLLGLVGIRRKMR